MKRILLALIYLGCMIFPAVVCAQSSGPTPPPPPTCSQMIAGQLYTETGTNPYTVYTCSYYNLAWQWVVNPSYGGLVSYPTVPTTCSGALPVFLAGWPEYARICLRERRTGCHRGDREAVSQPSQLPQLRGLLGLCRQ